MNSVYLYISLGALLVTAMFTITPQLHMLQQSSYYNMRFWGYLKTAPKKFAVLSAVCSAAIAVLAFLSPISCMILSVLSSAVRIFNAVSKHKNSKKKLVFTGRVKRMYCTLAVLCVIIALFFAFAKYAVCAASVMLAAAPFTAMLVNLINSPIENSVKLWYLNDAKKILKNHNKMTVIGLTGSYGKTSTKHILARFLSERYNVTATPGGINTPMGVVRTIRENLKPDSEIFIVEMGAKRVGDIKELCDIVHPNTGIITSVGPQHLNTFGSIENVVKTKFELADEVSKVGGNIYLNLDSEYIDKNADNYKFRGYSIKNKRGDVRAENVKASRGGLTFDIVCGERRINVSTKLLGMHNVLNILAAAAIAIDMGLSDTDIKYAASCLVPVSHRLEMKPFYRGSVLIDDAYNANPEGSLEAMRVIGSFAPMKRIVVTPGLVELGEKEYECNVALGKAAAENADEVIFVGEQRSKPLVDGVAQTDFDRSNMKVVKTFNDAAAYLRTVCDKNTVVIFENDLPDIYAG